MLAMTTTIRRRWFLVCRCWITEKASTWRRSKLCTFKKKLIKKKRFVFYMRTHCKSRKMIYYYDSFLGLYNEMGQTTEEGTSEFCFQKSRPNRANQRTTQYCMTSTCVLIFLMMGMNRMRKHILLYPSGGCSVFFHSSYRIKHEASICIYVASFECEWFYAKQFSCTIRCRTSANSQFQSISSLHGTCCCCTCCHQIQDGCSGSR